MRYYGSINLNAIKDAIEGGVKPFEGKKGKYLEVSVKVLDEPDQFGNSLSISVYNKEKKEATYLGNLKVSAYQYEDDAPQQSNNQSNNDLPF